MNPRRQQLALDIIRRVSKLFDHCRCQREHRFREPQAYRRGGRRNLYKVQFQAIHQGKLAHLTAWLTEKLRPIIEHTDTQGKKDTLSVRERNLLDGGEGLEYNRVIAPHSDVLLASIKCYSIRVHRSGAVSKKRGGIRLKTVALSAAWLLGFGNNDPNELCAQPGYPHQRKRDKAAFSGCDFAAYSRPTSPISSCRAVPGPSEWLHTTAYNILDWLKAFIGGMTVLQTQWAFDYYDAIPQRELTHQNVSKLSRMGETT